MIIHVAGLWNSITMSNILNALQMHLMEALLASTRTVRDKDEMLMLKESFHQLAKLQEECNQELSNFQREKFIAHEEFRAISAHLHQMINDFQIQINTELDKIMLRINQLEIIAMHAFKSKCRPILSCANARYMDCSKEYILIATALGEIRAYDNTTLKVVSEVTQQTYDPLQTHGKITKFYATDRLFVGFADGFIISFALNDLTSYTEMSYHKSAITAIHQFGDYVATGCNSGVVVLWNAVTLERLVIVPVHRLSIASIIDNGSQWIVVDRTGVVSIHDQTFSQQVDKFSLSSSILHAFRHGENGMITISDKLLMWEGKHIVKTFNAVPIDSAPICCMKRPEMLLLGSQQSTELKFVFLESLLFPKTVNVLDSPPLSIVQYSSFFYVLTKKGNVYQIEPSS